MRYKSDDRSLRAKTLMRSYRHPIIGTSPSGKAPGFGPGIRGFESLRPSQEIIERKKDVQFWASFYLAKNHYTLGKFDQSSNPFCHLRIA
jgi:hypothetical protein